MRDNNQPRQSHEEAFGSSGVPIEFIREERLKDKAQMEKIRLILDNVREGNIVVINGGLSPDDESKLIETTMTEIQPDNFTGIEIESFPGTESESGFIDRLLGKDEENNSLRVIGPAQKIDTLHKDETIISTIVRK